MGHSGSPAKDTLLPMVEAPPPHQDCGRRGLSGEKRLSEAQRCPGEDETRIQRARKEHKFKAEQKGEMAESASLFPGGPGTSRNGTIILQAELVMQG